MGFVFEGRVNHVLCTLVMIYHADTHFDKFTDIDAVALEMSLLLFHGIIHFSWRIQHQNVTECERVGLFRE